MRNFTLQTIIVNYRTPELTLKAALAARSAMSELRGEITIVDNASRDGSVPFLQDAIALENQSHGAPITLISSEVNGGFGAGVNIGIEAGFADGSRPDFFYLLNSDATPAEDAILTLLEAIAVLPETGIAGSYIHGTDHAPHLTAFRFPGVLSEFENAACFGPVSKLLKSRRVAMPLPRQSRAVDWLAGASMLIRREVIEDVGHFDETFFLYFEETDLCRRAKQAGWATVYVPQSRVAHVGSASTGMQSWQEVPEYWLDSRHFYFVKTGGLAITFLANLAATTGAVLHSLQAALRGRKSSAPLRLAMRQNRHFLGHFKRKNQQAPLTRTPMKPNLRRI